MAPELRQHSDRARGECPDPLRKEGIFEAKTNPALVLFLAKDFFLDERIYGSLNGGRSVAHELAGMLRKEPFALFVMTASVVFCWMARRLL